MNAKQSAVRSIAWLDGWWIRLNTNELLTFFARRLIDTEEEAVCGCIIAERLENCRNIVAPKRDGLTELMITKALGVNNTKVNVLGWWNWNLLDCRPQGPVKRLRNLARALPKAEGRIVGHPAARADLRIVFIVGAMIASVPNPEVFARLDIAARGDRLGRSNDAEVAYWTEREPRNSKSCGANDEQG